MGHKGHLRLKRDVYLHSKEVDYIEDKRNYKEDMRLHFCYILW
jgi:hypothetical protein